MPRKRRDTKERRLKLAICETLRDAEHHGIADLMRAEIAKEMGADIVDSLGDAVRGTGAFDAPQSWGVIGGLRALGVIDRPPVQVNVDLATKQAFGMTPDEVGRIIRAHQESSATTVEQCAEDCLALMRWVLQQEPKYRAAFASALGGENALVLAETNGHGNGNGNGNGAA